MTMASIQLVEEGIDPSSFDDKNLPTDVHLITYTNPEGEEKVDAVRAYTMVDIFDIYHDRKCKVHRIQSGFGRIKPKLYGKIVTEE